MESCTRKLTMMVLILISSVLAFQAPLQQIYAENRTFSSPINLSESSAGTIDRELSAYSNNVYVVWSEDAVTGHGATTGKADIFFRASKDNGTSFGKVINLSSNSGNSLYPDIVSSGNNVFVVWQDDSYGSKEVFFARSTDNGLTFSNTINISNNHGDSEFPDIAVSGNNVFVIWRDTSFGNYDILFRASTDNGASFSDVVNLSNNRGESYLNARATHIAASGNNVYVVWYDYSYNTDSPANSEILFIRSIDKGASFEDTVRLSNSDAFSGFPQIALSNNKIYITWADDTPGNRDIYFARSTDNGDTFSEPVNISNTPGSSEFPQITASGNNAYIVWTDYVPDSFNGDILLRRGIDSGASFDTVINLSNDGQASNPRLATYDGNMYVVWQDRKFGNSDILLRASTDNGDTFSEPVNISKNQGRSAGPRIASYGGNVYILWSDADTGTSETFLVSGTTKQSAIQTPVPTNPPLTITSISNAMPRWSLDAVTLTGTVTNALATDTITIDWGDGTSTTRISHSDGSWGSVSHTYDSKHVDTYQIVAKLIDRFGEEKAISTSHRIEVQKHATKLEISNIANVGTSNYLTVKGFLIDIDTNKGIGGKTITFNATGISLSSVTTNADGSFVSTGKSSNHNEVKLQAYFAGDDLYIPSSTLIESNNTSEQMTEEFIVNVSNVAIVDSNNNKLSNISVGEEVLVQSNIANKNKKEQSLTYIVQIKDKDGYTVFLSWIKGSIQSNQSIKASVAWTPDTSGNYIIEIFVWKDASDPQILSDVSRINLTVDE